MGNRLMAAARAMPMCRVMSTSAELRRAAIGIRCSDFDHVFIGAMEHQYALLRSGLGRHDRTHAPQQILGDTAGTNLPLGDASIAEIIARSAFLPGAEALQ